MGEEIKNVEYGLEKIFEGAQDFLPLLGTDYVEFYVGNAKQAAHFYKTAFGFQSLAYAGLETGMKDRASYVLKQGKIRLVLTTALNSESPIGEHVKKHGDGVKVVALWVDDARKAYEETTSRGAKSYMEPTVEKDADGEVVLEFTRMEKRFTCLWSARTTTELSFPVTKSGSRIITLNQRV
jgi:4-hydroxyphenylpyruvate dioxygenase